MHLGCKKKLVYILSHTLQFLFTVKRFYFSHVFDMFYTSHILKLEHFLENNII